MQYSFFDNKCASPYYMLSNEFINLACISIGNYNMSTTKNAVYLQSKLFTLQTDLDRQGIPQLGIQ